MYASSSSFNPFEYTQGHTNITSSIQEDHSSPFLHLPSPFLDHADLLLNDFLTHHHHQQQQQQILVSNTNLEGQTIQEMNPAANTKKATRSNNKKKRSNPNGTKQPIPRKRTGKKDRHSKIYTAQGPRDRRMRLSLQIARKFFDLQDMLGFDKASKTIDWLFTKSKAAIKELTDSRPKHNVKRTTSSSGGQSVSSTSESEVMSSGSELTPGNGGKREIIAEGDSFVSISRQKSSKNSNKPSVINTVIRESREKARARARERTKEKQKIEGFNQSKHYSQANPNDFKQLGPATSLDNGKNLGFGNQEMESLLTIPGEEDQEPGTYLLQHQMNSVSIVDKFLGLRSAPKSSSIFGLSHNAVVPSASVADFEDEFSVFPGNWDNTNARIQNRCCVMPGMKLSRGNVHVQNPSAIFLTTQNAQEYKPSSNLITISNAQEHNLTSLFIPSLNTHEENPSSLFINFSNSNEQQNPSPSPMTTINTEGLFSRFRLDLLSCNPYATN